MHCTDRDAISALAQAAASVHCKQCVAGKSAHSAAYDVAVGCLGGRLKACRLGSACMLTLLCGRLQSSISLPGSRLASPEAPFSHQQAASLMYGLPPGLMSGASPAGDLHRMQQHIAQLQRGGAPGARQPRRGLSGVPLAQLSGGLVHASQVHICITSGTSVHCTTLVSFSNLSRACTLVPSVAERLEPALHQQTAQLACTSL